MAIELVRCNNSLASEKIGNHKTRSSFKIRNPPKAFTKFLQSSTWLSFWSAYLDQKCWASRRLRNCKCHRRSCTSASNYWTPMKHDSKPCSDYNISAEVEWLCNPQRSHCTHSSSPSPRIPYRRLYLSHTRTQTPPQEERWCCSLEPESKELWSSHSWVGLPRPAPIQKARIGNLRDGQWDLWRKLPSHSGTGDPNCVRSLPRVWDSRWRGRRWRWGWRCPVGGECRPW